MSTMIINLIEALAGYVRERALELGGRQTCCKNACVGADMVSKQSWEETG